MHKNEHAASWIRNGDKKIVPLGNNEPRLGKWKSLRKKATACDHNRKPISTGVEGDRTLNLRIANAALSQLSYDPRDGLLELYLSVRLRQPRPMNQIPPHLLWIGASGDLRDWRRLYDLGIHAVVELAYEETAMSLPHDLIVCRFPLVDGDDNQPEMLALAVNTLTRLLEAKLGCLVCCQAGLSRSPAVAGAALAKLTGQPLLACLHEIAKHRPLSIHPALWTQVQALGDLPAVP